MELVRGAMPSVFRDISAAKPECDGGVWRWSVVSPGAQALRVRVSGMQPGSALYFAFFGRSPSAGDVAFHVALLNGSVLSRTGWMNLLNSAEFNRAGRFVAGLYPGLLNRDADYFGWLFIRNALVTGAVNQDQVVINILS